MFDRTKKTLSIVSRRFTQTTLVILMLCQTTDAFSSVADAFDRSATQSKLGPKAALMSAAKVGDHVVVVGERGLILRSDDDGKSWRQLPSPVSVTLTGVRFTDDKNGYAIGHGGIVLRTADGGAEWKVQLDGRALAQTLLKKAEASNDEEAIYQAKLLVSDGPDKPFLDMLLLSPDHLIVVGAYGLVLETKDGGKTWASWMDRIQNYFGLHLYSIRKQADRILVAGEQGFVALSTDNGQTFTTLETPYEGSYFTAELLGDSEIVLAGLRGNTLISNDNGADWKNIKNPISASILASYISANGQIIMANQAGILLGLTENRLVPLTRKRLPPLTNILEKANGNVLALSINGPVSIDVGDLK